jgi:sugar (pentulose or hexulose) kinase
MPAHRGGDGQYRPLYARSSSADLRRRRIWFNTLYKLIWLKENHPQLLEQAHAWLFISSLLNQRLTGEFTTDITMAGTSQMLDIHQRDFSAQILQATGLPRRLFPGWLKRASRSARCGAMPRSCWV